MTCRFTTAAFRMQKFKCAVLRLSWNFGANVYALEKREQGCSGISIAPLNSTLSSTRQESIISASTTATARCVTLRGKFLLVQAGCRIRSERCTFPQSRQNAVADRRKVSIENDNLDQCEKVVVCKV